MTRPRHRGRLIALEGIDGTGKSTLQHRLAVRLRRDGFRVALWHEPTDPELGRQAQAVAPTDPAAAAVGFTLDRLLARPRLLEQLRSNDVVVADRSFYSTLAYQGSALPRAARLALAALQRSATIPPDRVLWLSLPPERALSRVGARGRRRSPLERRRTLERVARAYKGFARSPRWRTLDAELSPVALAESAHAILRPWLARPRPPRGRRGA